MNTKFKKDKIVESRKLKISRVERVIDSLIVENTGMSILEIFEKNILTQKILLDIFMF